MGGGDHSTKNQNELQARELKEVSVITFLINLINFVIKCCSIGEETKGKKNLISLF